MAWILAVIYCIHTNIILFYPHAIFHSFHCRVYWDIPILGRNLLEVDSNITKWKRLSIEVPSRGHDLPARSAVGVQCVVVGTVDPLQNNAHCTSSWAPCQYSWQRHHMMSWCESAKQMDGQTDTHTGPSLYLRPLMREGNLVVCLKMGFPNP